jgi:hypothetical protein
MRAMILEVRRPRARTLFIRSLAEVVVAVAMNEKLARVDRVFDDLAGGEIHFLDIALWPHLFRECVVGRHLKYPLPILYTARGR